MEHLASVAEMAQENERDDVGVESKNRQPAVNLSSSSSLKLNRKRNSDDMYLSAEEKIDLNKLIASQESYIFPRDDQLNYICVFQGCTKPILRGMNTEDYFDHLRAHATQSDRLLSNMLRRVSSAATVVEQGDKKAKRRRANSTNTYNTITIVPKKQKEGIDGAFEKEDSNGSPGGSPSSPESPPRKRMNSTDEYNIPLKPSSRGVQLRDQMLRYGLHLFRIDSEGKYICFFDECSLHMMTNFSRHIAKHEKNGDKIKQELLHLCSPAIVQQQLQQHPNMHIQNHPSSSTSHPPPSPHPQGPLQQLLLRHQQEAVQLQQQQQQQQLSVHSPPQLDQLQQFHAVQFQQLQMQHNQQLQMLHQTLSSAPPSPHQQLAQQNPSLMYGQQQELMSKRPKSNIPELNLLSQVRDESDLALMRTQISKMLEDSSRNHPNFSSLSNLGPSPTPSLTLSPSPSPSPHPPSPHVPSAPHRRSLSLAYYNSPSMQESPSLRHPYHPSTPSQLNPPRSSLHSPTSQLYSPRMQSQPHDRSTLHSPPPPLPPHSELKHSPYVASSPCSSSPRSSSPSSPSSPPSSEIQWIFPKTKPVLSK